MYFYFFRYVCQYTHLKWNSEKGDQETLKWAYKEEIFRANFELIVLDLEELNTSRPSIDISKNKTENLQ